MHYVRIGLLSVALSGCAQLQDVCTTEKQAHAVYSSMVGPLRPLAAQAREAKFYATVTTLCAFGGSSAQINAAAAQAQSARTQ
jgi:hypothetical protein